MNTCLLYYDFFKFHLLKSSIFYYEEKNFKTQLTKQRGIKSLRSPHDNYENLMSQQILLYACEISLQELEIQAMIV